ncbi:MAG TPA: hypothetical protein VJ698_13525 [Noviherbaspirillum sp.]|uniref:hypothetical protein n=1 Tax=Noviherbaspirillum sp. TaxID=1926288 RepID=UPI002B4644BA|nr:hypothetical protein [Noviherbaspirillum sp.]HJV86488.1 hypothetical protein [Noviherbaspirillum sp.]
MNPAICLAINEKRLIELRYHGYSRMVEPHIYGEDKNGDEVVRCFQLAGGSQSGERAGWKLLKIREALVVLVTETRFEPRAEFQRNDKVVRKVFCEV